MNVCAQELPFAFFPGMDEPAFLEALCQGFGVRVVRVPSQGSCFFDTIYALLPTVGKAVRSSRDLRLQIVSFFRECHAQQHDILGQRIEDDLQAALHQKIISSSAQTRGHNKKPRNMEAYFEAVSKNSVWVEGRCTP